MLINRILTVTSLAILAGGLASADTFVTTSATPVGPASTDFSFSLVFGATATPVGFHLVGATLSITDLIADSTLTLTNNGSGSEMFSFEATSQADISSNSVDSTFVGSSTSPSVILDLVGVTFTASESTKYAPLSITSVLGPTAVSNPAGYLAGATIDGSTLSGTTLTGGGGNISLDQAQSATIDGKLVFDFAPNSTTPTIPEPASILLFGTTLLSVGWLGRRHRAK